MLDFNPEKGTISIYDSGHSLIYLFRKQESFRLKTSQQCPPLGISQDFEIKPDCFQLIPGDLVFLFTDGLTEQNNGNGEEFGDRQISRILKDANQKSLAQIREEIYSNIDKFRENQPQNDDISFILLEYNG